jgi:signal transduction histidine kinase
MKAPSGHALFRTLGWRLTLLNGAILCAILLLLSGALYLSEVLATDAQISQLLTQTVQQEREEDLVQILQSRQPVVDPLRRLNPAPLQAFFLLIDTTGRVHEGASALVAGLPDQEAVQRALATGTPDMRERTVDRFHLRLETVSVLDRTGKPVGAIQVYVSLAGRDAELERLLLVLLGGSALAMGVATLAARFLAIRALVPIHRAFAQQEQFVADASHELRAPLTLLQADVEVLKRAMQPLPPPDADTERSQGTDSSGVSDDLAAVFFLSAADLEVIDEMHAEIRHMSTLISDLLTLARYDAGGQPFDLQVVDLVPLLSSIVERLSAQVTQARLSLSFQLPDDLSSLTVAGDSPALRRLFLVLLHNAITYTPAGGQIWLGAKLVAGTGIEVTVRDTGRGIAPDDLPHVFKRFYRADKARTRYAPGADEKGPGGIGIGLAIAQSIVERHAGTIAVSSAGEGQGSTFTVLLQRASFPEIRSSRTSADSI